VAMTSTARAGSWQVAYGIGAAGGPIAIPKVGKG